MTDKTDHHDEMHGEKVTIHMPIRKDGSRRGAKEKTMIKREGVNEKLSEVFVPTGDKKEINADSWDILVLEKDESQLIIVPPAQKEDVEVVPPFSTMIKEIKDKMGDKPIPKEEFEKVKKNLLTCTEKLVILKSFDIKVLREKIKIEKAKIEADKSIIDELEDISNMAELIKELNEAKERHKEIVEAHEEYLKLKRANIKNKLIFRHVANTLNNDSQAMAEVNVMMSQLKTISKSVGINLKTNK